MTAATIETKSLLLTISYETAGASAIGRLSARRSSLPPTRNSPPMRRQTQRGQTRRFDSQGKRLERANLTTGAITTVAAQGAAHIFDACAADTLFVTHAERAGTTATRSTPKFTGLSTQFHHKSRTVISKPLKQVATLASLTVIIARAVTSAGGLYFP